MPFSWHSCGTSSSPRMCPKGIYLERRSFNMDGSRSRFSSRTLCCRNGCARISAVLRVIGSWNAIEAFSLPMGDCYGAWQASSLSKNRLSLSAARKSVAKRPEENSTSFASALLSIVCFQRVFSSPDYPVSGYFICRSGTTRNIGGIVKLLLLDRLVRCMWIANLLFLHNTILFAYYRAL